MDDHPTPEHQNDDAPLDQGVDDVAAIADDAIDLDVIESELAAVEQALTRLAEGTYWTDEVTGEPIPDELLIAHPTARRSTESSG